MTSGAERLEYGTQVTSEQDPHGQNAAGDPVDPVYDALFRPGDTPQAPAQESAPATPAPPAPREPGADTGRLFRSQGVQGHDEAVLALDSGRFSRLRTLERETGGAAPEVAATAIAESAMIGRPAPGGEPTPQDAAVASLLAPPPADIHAPLGENVSPADSPRRSRRRGRGVQVGGSAGLRAGGVYLIVIGVTVIIGFANAILGGGALGWPTGLALLVASVYAALTVRREDDYSAFLTPPIAFALAALTAGQLFLGSNESGFLNRIVVAFFSLADNWVWIIGSTLIALIIVLVRRRR